MPRRIAYLIPLLVGLALAISVGIALYADQERYSQKFRLEVFYKLSTLQGELENRLNERLQLVDTIKTFVMINPELSQETFLEFSGRLFFGVSGIRQVLVAKGNKVIHAYPSNDMNTSLGRDLLTDYTPEVRQLVVKVRHSLKRQISGPVFLKEGDMAIFSATPVPLSTVNSDEYERGLVLVSMDADALFSGIKSGQGASSLDVALRKPGQHSGEFVMLHGKERVFSKSPVLMNIHTPGSYWQLAGFPVGGWPKSPNHDLILYGGGSSALVVSILLFFMVYLLLRGIQEREKYRYLIQNAKSIILRIDLSANISFSNEYADKFFGFEVGELLGKPLVGTIIPVRNLQGEPAKRFINRLLDNPTAHTFNENICMRKNGELVWVAWANDSVADNDGNMVELLCVGTDITDRKIMEDARKQSERQYRLLAENVTDVIMGLDAERCYTYISPSDEALRGFGRHELLGRPVDDFLAPQSGRIFNDILDKLVSQIAKGAMTHDTTLDLEFTCSDGSTVWLECRLGLLLNEDAELIGVQGVGRDISDRKRAEMLRDDMERMAQHDLKTPLGAVVGLPGEIRRMGELSAMQDGMLTTIEEAGENMLNLINRSLDLFKMESGSYVLNKSAVDVLQMVESIKNETRAVVREKGVSVGVETPAGEDRSFLVTVEEPLFRSMLSNLIVNAFQASPVGGAVTISLTHGENVTISIRNNGEVPKGVREVFFDKYASSTEGGGSGLGTYSARLIARTHGGDIAVDTSIPGETSVRMTLPL